MDSVILFILAMIGSVYIVGFVYGFVTFFVYDLVKSINPFIGGEFSIILYKSIRWMKFLPSHVDKMWQELDDWYKEKYKK